MSQAVLKKAPSPWLDTHDAKAVEYECAAQLAEAQNDLETRLEDLEVIMGTPSRQVSLANSTSGKEGFTNVMKNDLSSSLVINTTETNQICGGSCAPIPLSHTDIGDSRLIGVSGLIVIRLLCLGCLGIMAGLSFSLRKTAPLEFLLIELFVWLHVLILLLYPFLLLGSIMTMQYPDDDDTNLFGEDYHGKWSGWNLLATACHVVKAFSITEVIRLLISNAVPSMRPFYGQKDAESLFSLLSVFAVQRYLLLVVAITEILFSTTPQQVLNIAIVVLISTCWETIMSVTQNPGKSVGERIVIMLSNIALATATSVVLILLQTLFSRTSSKLSSTSDSDNASSSVEFI